MTTSTRPERPANSGDRQLVLDGQRSHGASALVHVFVILPMLAAVPLARGRGLSWMADHRRRPTPSRLTRLASAVPASGR